MYYKKRNRILFIAASFLLVFMGVSVILYNLDENIVFFYPPSEMDKIMAASGKIRVGGLVKEGSIKEIDSITIFIITDNHMELVIECSADLPALFRENQGIVAEGALDKDRMIFVAKKLLAKHDENYMPPEVKRSLETRV